MLVTPNASMTLLVSDTEPVPPRKELPSGDMEAITGASASWSSGANVITRSSASQSELTEPQGTAGAEPWRMVPRIAWTPPVGGVKYTLKLLNWGTLVGENEPRSVHCGFVASAAHQRSILSVVATARAPTVMSIWRPAANEPMIELFITFCAWT